MGITNANKVLDQSRMDCDGTLKVTLALTAAPDILSNPADIALILDRSGSMSGTPLENMKTGAKTFIDILSQSTGGQPTGEIGSGSRIGIVSFADTAVQDTQMITSVDALNSAVDALSAGGSTNHADAFAEAAALFDFASGNARIMVLFTDGNTTAGVPPAPVAAAARAQGITIYCIGLIGSDGIDVDALNDWATDPDAAHVAVTPDAADLEQLFADLAANISKPGATNLVIDERVTADFEIVSVLSPTLGSAVPLGPTALRWTIPALGVSASESAALEFVVRHVGDTSGVTLVNESISYTDTEGNQVNFPEPAVLVECDAEVCPEKCSKPVELTIGGCCDSAAADLGAVRLESLGRILQVDVTIRQVCPGKRVALAVLLSEVDSNGAEHSRGRKILTIPAHTFPSCRDVRVRCIPFVLPEEGNASDGTPQGQCSPRRLRARVLANYLDSGSPCCCCDPTVTA